MDIDNDSFGGATPTGTIVASAWQPYGQLVSNLPPGPRERDQRIHEAAMRKARTFGWDPELDDEEN